MFNRLRMIMAVALSQALSRTPLSLQRIVQNHNRTVDVLRDAASAEPLRPRRRMFEGAARLIGRRGIDRSRMHWGPNGAQECARRVRQIAAYQLTASNGLVMPAVGERGKFVTGDGHGGLRYWPS